MMTFIVGATCLFIGICVGIQVEYRNGYLDRHLCKKWPVPQPVVPHADFVDECDQFNEAMIKTSLDQRLVHVGTETIQ